MEPLNEATIPSLSAPAVQQTIRELATSDQHQLVLAGKTLACVPAALVAQQIAARRKAAYKLPRWHAAQGIVYPPLLNLEQCSSQAAAMYRAAGLPGGELAIDLTGGFGVDAFFLASRYQRVIMVEPDKGLLACARHNHSVLGAANIQYVNASAEKFLSTYNGNADVAYIDPSRRSANQKVFLFKECTPDVTQLLPLLQRVAGAIVIKASPLLDIQQGLTQLTTEAFCRVLSVDDECKELSFIISQNHGAHQREAVDVDNVGSVRYRFAFTAEEESQATPQFSAPLQWLYQPGAAIMKAGAFKCCAARFDLSKLEVNTHLYTHMGHRPEFPGRTYKVLQQVQLNKKLALLFPEKKANVVVRNFPLSAAAIKEKTGLKDGGNLYLICTRSVARNHYLLAERVQ